MLYQLRISVRKMRESERDRQRMRKPREVELRGLNKSGGNL